MLNSLQQHRASLALWDAHSARFPIRATIVPALDHEERREILSMKMPHLPSLVGGAFFYAFFSVVSVKAMPSMSKASSSASMLAPSLVRSTRRCACVWETLSIRAMSATR